MDLPIWVFVIVGFLAQLIDGALGMGYGVSSNSFLLGLGLSPVVSSASVHMTEVFTTAISGTFHLRFGNVRKDLFLKLFLPGMLGGALGAYILSSIDSHAIKPFISIYLLVMGVVILRKALNNNVKEKRVTTWVGPLGLIGGFLDALGGGGWGAIVTTTLVVRGNDPRASIGSVNISKFFVAFAQSVVFVLSIGLIHWKIIAGMLIGGVFAAPVAAYLTKKLPTRALMALVGLLICFLSIRGLWPVVQQGVVAFIGAF